MRTRQASPAPAGSLWSPNRTMGTADLVPPKIVFEEIADARQPFAPQKPGAEVVRPYRAFLGGLDKLTSEFVQRISPVNLSRRLAWRFFLSHISKHMALNLT